MSDTEWINSSWGNFAVALHVRRKKLIGHLQPNYSLFSATFNCRSRKQKRTLNESFKLR